MKGADVMRERIEEEGNVWDRRGWERLCYEFHTQEEKKKREH